ncbi:MAG: hypothetical protein DRJ40_02560 [Thermoprotei archaeon]|nr:MAG: hypothetical protein DRJ40_02560 [Thermoprotei archaeon]
MLEKTWCKRVEELISKLSKVFGIEAVIVFGSWARSGGGEWSDLDVLVVTDDVKNIDILERFRIATEYKPPRVDVFLYTYGELENMMKRGNPLALSALVEGIPLKASSRVLKLMEVAKQRYIRRGRVWIETTKLQ